MQVKSSVKLPACFLSFPLQVCQELTQSNTCGHVQVSELEKKKQQLLWDIFDSQMEKFFPGVPADTAFPGQNEAYPLDM